MYGEKQDYARCPSHIYIVFLRYVCGMVMHMQENLEIQKGMQNMKFVVNHSYRFENAFVAFAAGFM